MKNLDNIKNLEDARKELFEAMMAEDAEKQEMAFTNFTEALQNDIMNKADEKIKNVGNEYNDKQILINRGIMKPLTSTEMKFFNEVVERKGFEGVKSAFPVTIIQDVFKKLKTEHPILSKIDMVDTTGLAKYIFAKPNEAKGFWGPICEDIKQMILAGFEEVDLDSSRLSGFVAVCKGMIELGPEWLAEYIVTLIYEVMAASLEVAVVAGDGKNKPIGMIKKLSGAVDFVYPDKDKVTLTELDYNSLVGVRAALAKANLDGAGVAVLVNPVTYWSKLFTALVLRTPEGEFVKDRLSTGEEIITSYAVPEDVLVIGNPANYFLGVSGDVRIDKYTETLAIEDMDLYIAKFYGFGVAKDPNAFFVADIAGVKGATVPKLEEFKASKPVTPSI